MGKMYKLPTFGEGLVAQAKVWADQASSLKGLEHLGLKYAAELATKMVSHALFDQDVVVTEANEMDDSILVFANSSVTVRLGAPDTYKVLEILFIAQVHNRLRHLSELQVLKNEVAQLRRDLDRSQKK